jgi:hypothetical protein
MSKRLLSVIVLIFLFASIGFAQKGSINGRVFNAKTNLPLEFLTVYLEGTTIGSTSDLDGKFIFTGIEPGFYKVIATAVGYEKTISSEIHVQGNRVAFVEIPVIEKELQLKEVVVSKSISLKKLESPLSLLTVGVQALEKTAGVNRDVSKVVQTLPGVGPTNVQRNDLIVRGGGPSENVFYLDGVEIPIINHFATQGSSGGVVSILNADFIREINFYTGAFPANRGNALSSVMDIKQRDGDKDRLHANFVLGSSDAGLTLDGPIGEKTTFIASARQSYLQILFDFIGLPFLPTYNDFQFKLRTQLGSKDDLTFVGVGAIDNMVLNTTIDNPSESQNYILSYLPIYEQWNYAIGTVYKHFSDSYFDTWVLSRNMLRNHNFKYLNNDESLAKTQDYLSDEAENKLRFERNYPDLPIRLNIGASIKYAHYTNSTYRQILLSNVPSELTYQTDLNVFAYQFFAQASDTYLDENMRVSFGVSFGGNDYNSNMANVLNQFSPRLSASYRLNDAWTLNASLGRYLLQPSYTSLGYRNNAGVLVNQNEQVRYTGSNQVVVGVELVPSKAAKLTMEGFYKAYDHYGISVNEGVSLASKGTEYGQVGDEEIVSTGSGRAYGLEFLFKLMDQKRVNLSATYTLFKSEFTNAAGVYQPSSWDTRHIVNVLAAYKFDKSLTVGGRWLFVGGAPYTPVDESLSSIKTVWDIRNQPFLDYTRYNQARLDGSHILDLRVDKEFYFKKWMLNIYMDVQNVYNFQSEGNPIYTNLDVTGNPVTDTSDPNKYVLRKIDVLGGNLLPTLGLMVTL